MVCLGDMYTHLKTNMDTVWYDVTSYHSAGVRFTRKNLTTYRTFIVTCRKMLVSYDTVSRLLDLLTRVPLTWILLQQQQQQQTLLLLLMLLLLLLILVFVYPDYFLFLPRCIECRGSSEEKAVCLSVRLSNACIVTKGKKYLSRFLYHTKDHLA